MRYAIAVAGMLGLAGCDATDGYPPQFAACRAALTYGESYGTPENKGPCWGRTISHSVSGNIRSYLVEANYPGYVVASLTYRGNTLIQAGETRGR